MVRPEENLNGVRCRDFLPERTWVQDREQSKVVCSRNEKFFRSLSICLVSVRLMTELMSLFEFPILVTTVRFKS